MRVKFTRTSGLFLEGSNRDSRSCSSLRIEEDPLTRRSVDPVEVGELHQGILLLKYRSQIYESIDISLR
jgi:hypothetical protein